MRTLKAAMDLFASYGVGATSYQMIADALGVTKGAVYHQFKTKNEIIIAVAEMELAKLEDALEAAEAEDSPVSARELLLNRVIDHAMEGGGAACRGMREGTTSEASTRIDGTDCGARIRRREKNPARQQASRVRHCRSARFQASRKKTASKRR